MSALALKHRHPDLDVCVIRSREIGIVGVGEGSTPALTRFLHQYLKVDTGDFYRTARPTWKLGLRFIWGPRPYFNYTFGPGMEMRYSDMPKPTGFYCAETCEYTDLLSAMMTHDRVFEGADTGIAFHDSFAYHVENEYYVTFLERHAAALGVRIVDGTVHEVRQGEEGIRSLELVSGASESADLYVDCSGYASVLLGKALGEPYIPFDKALFCDRAVVGGWARGADEPIKPYTICETMESGWAWQIEHENRINRGYVYSSDFIADDAAEVEFRTKNPKVSKTRVVKFVAGRYERNWVKNVVAIGNAAGFVEPLEATSLAVIGIQAAMLSETLWADDRVPTASNRWLVNDHHARLWDTVRGFIALHYKFNTRLDTPFWVACREKTELGRARPIVEYYEENGPSEVWVATLTDECDQFKLGGYWTLLAGMAVPYRTAYVPTAGQIELMNNKRA
jgi:tryptophan halogenase